MAARSPAPIAVSGFPAHVPHSPTQARRTPAADALRVKAIDSTRKPCHAKYSTNSPAGVDGPSVLPPPPATGRWVVLHFVIEPALSQPPEDPSPARRRPLHEAAHKLHYEPPRPAEPGEADAVAPAARLSRSAVADPRPPAGASLRPWVCPASHRLRARAGRRTARRGPARREAPTCLGRARRGLRRHRYESAVRRAGHAHLSRRPPRRPHHGVRDRLPSSGRSRSWSR